MATTIEQTRFGAMRDDYQVAPAGVTVVLPTYREAMNLSTLIPSIYAVLGRPLQILIVDDDSQDDTDRIIQYFMDMDYPVSLITRLQERGLASAIFRGITEAVFDRVIVMDADGQHPVSLLPQFVVALETCDLAVGTR